MLIFVEISRWLKSLIETTPLPGMMVIVPLAMAALAAVSAAIARLVEDWLSRSH